MPGQPRYRGLRRTANREALLDAAEELFSKRGFAAVSVDDIVARAGVAKGTFYNHFADKRDLAAALAIQIRHEVRDRIAQTKAASDDPAMHLAIAVSLFLDLALTRPNRALILVSLLSGATDATAGFNQPLRNTLEDGLTLGRFRFSDLDSALVTVLGIVSAAIRHLIEQPPPDPQTRLTGFVLHILAAVGFEQSGAAQIVAASAIELVRNVDQASRRRSSPTTPVQIRN